MKAKYYKIYAAEYLKNTDKGMGFVKEMDNNALVIYKEGRWLLERIDNVNAYLDIFEKKRCTKKEFKKAFDEAINFYKKLV